MNPIGTPLDVEVARCRVNSAAREVKPIHVETLARSIGDVGLIQPISVRRVGTDFEVIAGVHRLMAFRQMGREYIPALVRETDDLRAELALIDENLIRNELSPAERALAISRRKAIYESLHPETVQHVAGGKARQNSASDKLSFAESTAQATGKHRRTVEREASRGETLGESTLKAVTGTSLDKGEELDALARLDPEHRERLVNRATAGEEVSARSGDGALPNGSRAIMGSRIEPDDSLDFFPTPPWATRALCEHVLPRFINARSATAWEPAAGEGHMAEPLKEYFKEVYATDIHDYGYGDGGVNFLNPGLSDYVADFIITNPPFGDLTEAFVLRALKVARVGVAMFVRLQWLESVGRYEAVFRDNPPSLIAFFAERVPLCKGRYDPEGSTATAYIWLVWRKGFQPSPPMWIPPGQCKALTLPDDAERFTQHPVARKQRVVGDEPFDAETGEVMTEEELICGLEATGLIAPESSENEMTPPPETVASSEPAPKDVPSPAGAGSPFNDEHLEIPPFLRRQAEVAA